MEKEDEETKQKKERGDVRREMGCWRRRKKRKRLVKTVNTSRRNRDREKGCREREEKVKEVQ